MIDLPELILNLRADLRDRMRFDLNENRDRYYAWLISSGIREYAALLEDKRFLSTVQFGETNTLTPLQRLTRQARPDVRAAFPLPERYSDFRLWFYTHGIEECVLWPFLSEHEKTMVRQLPEPWPSRLSMHMIDTLAPKGPDTPLQERPFGVNIIGYAYGQLGIGEDARMAARALQAAGIPFTLLNFPPGNDIPQNDRSMAEHVSERGDYAINMFCMTAEETGRYFAEKGWSQFKNRYNIGYWPWELSKWPNHWRMMLDLVHEVWVSTQHTYNALAPVCSKPLKLMPMAVELGPIRKFASRHQARKHFKLPLKATLFCFAFDLKSSVDRKNPQACVDAFLAAFPADTYSTDDVGLVIKVHKPTQPDQNWLQLKQLAAHDNRIHIIESTLPRPELLALYGACDSFISLHRAEGFGRGLAEALQLGLHVITTNYSGNIDFCQPPHASLVDYTLVPVRPGQYPHAENQVWADADIQHAAHLMRTFVHNRAAHKEKADWSVFSQERIGARYKQRILELQRLWLN